MELHYWPAEKQWGLPSFDMNSLHVLVYIKFSKATVKLTPTYRSWTSDKGHSLPCLKTSSNETFTSPELIIQYLQQKYYTPDTWMEMKDRQNMLPFSSLIEDKLIPAILAVFWLDSQNYTEITRGVYARNCQYPLNFTVPSNLHRSVENYVHTSKAVQLKESAKVTEKLYLEAAHVLNMFSEFLGENNYLFGERPSSLDALLFSCLAPLLKIHSLDSKLQNHLKGCGNLVLYITRILKHFQDDQKEQQQHVDNEWSYDWLLPVCVSAVAMVSYAVNVGLLPLAKP